MADHDRQNLRLGGGSVDSEMMPPTYGFLREQHAMTDARSRWEEARREAGRDYLEVARVVKRGGRTVYVRSATCRFGAAGTILGAVVCALVAPNWDPLATSWPLWVERIIIAMSSAALVAFVAAHLLWKRFTRRWFPLLDNSESMRS